MLDDLRRRLDVAAARAEMRASTLRSLADRIARDVSEAEALLGEAADETAPSSDADQPPADEEPRGKGEAPKKPRGRSRASTGQESGPVETLTCQDCGADVRRKSRSGPKPRRCPPCTRAAATRRAGERMQRRRAVAEPDEKPTAPEVEESEAMVAEATPNGHAARQCAKCGGAFATPRHNRTQRFCSHECSTQARTGQRCEIKGDRWPANVQQVQDELAAVDRQLRIEGDQDAIEALRREERRLSGRLERLKGGLLSSAGAAP